MRYQAIIFSILILAGLVSCVSMKERKSEKFYLQNRETIKSILSTYDSLYAYIPFNIGFSDRGFTKVGMDIITDTVRYAITNLQSVELFRRTIQGFHFDSARIRGLYEDLYSIKCIWLGKADFYFRGNRELLTYLSFKSVASGNPFLDRKYYTLVFFEPGLIQEEMYEKIASAGFKRIDTDIYFGILGKFR
jgi:hypothetical protein